MAAVYSITLLTPEGKLYEGRATALTAPGVEGTFGVLARHQPMIAALKNGQLYITTEDEQRVQFRLEGGVLEVTPYHDVLILADTAALV